MDNAPTPCGHFHDDWTIHVTVRVFTSFYYSDKKPYKEECPAPAGHVFQPTGTIFKHVQDIIGTNLLKKIHDDRTLNMASRVNHDQPPGGHFNEDRTIQLINSPPPAIFKLVQDIFYKNLLTRFHDDRTINVASRVFTISVKSNFKRKTIEPEAD
ncbi:hypothetical protein DPMN_068977 [Dreissena polymorpha]|uniref:Uncharacterized protein n=1 Tax=Dreissena polymorpha TaxID=45954 RepID=A0A9D3Z3F2_DREPO|nr:hypothetical protein DPMN_068977 [Dreissena polymorpha]